MSESHRRQSGPQLSNRTYDNLKKSATIVLPSIGTLYFALAQIWNFPNGEQVVGTIAAINVFVGVVLGVLSKNYMGDGVIKVEVEPNHDGGPPKKTFKLELNVEPEELEKMDEVSFIVDKSQANKTL